jgi:urate oxidase
MHLSKFTYGKGRVRIMRVARDAPRHEVRELTIQAMLEGAFAADAFLSADNTKTIATDSIKNIVNIVARQNLALDAEDFCAAIASYFLSHYGHVDAVNITAQETKWERLDIDGAAHDHAFKLDGNGRGLVKFSASRSGSTVSSGVENFTFLKTTESGWENFLNDTATTLPETHDRIFSTAMNATWRWQAAPANYPAANDKILAAMMKVFASTYSPSVQNSLYLMGSAALKTVPEISDITLACPNKHYIPLNLAAFKLDNPNVVFLPTDEPHGQIECTVSR